MKIDPSKPVFFYIAGPVPTKAESKHASAIRAQGGQVRMRNASQADQDKPERGATVVTGEVPDCYKEMEGITVLDFDPSAEGGEELDDKPKLTKQELTEKLTAMGVEIPSGLKVAELRELYERKSAELL